MESQHLTSLPLCLLHAFLILCLLHRPLPHFLASFAWSCSSCTVPCILPHFAFFASLFLSCTVPCILPQFLASFAWSCSSCTVHCILPHFSSFASSCSSCTVPCILPPLCLLFLAPSPSLLLGLFCFILFLLHCSLHLSSPCFYPSKLPNSSPTQSKAARAFDVIAWRARQDWDCPGRVSLVVCLYVWVCASIKACCLLPWGWMHSWLWLDATAGMRNLLKVCCRWARWINNDPCRCKHFSRLFLRQPYSGVYLEGLLQMSYVNNDICGLCFSRLFLRQSYSGVYLEGLLQMS